MHEALRRMYNWDDVVARTVRVYARVSAVPATPLHVRMAHALKHLGRFHGPFSCLLLGVELLVFILLRWLQ